jgi:hypothetical protein
MTVVIGPVLLIVASFLLGAVLVLAGCAIIFWIGMYQRRARNRVAKGAWGHAPEMIADQGGMSFVVPRK